MLLKKEKIIKISMEIGVSERTINYEIKKTNYENIIKRRIS